MKLEQVLDEIKNETEARLSTSQDNRVTMRMVSFVNVEEGLLVFTNSQSLKYRQLLDNNLGCFGIGNYYIEVEAEFLGKTMEEKNKDYRKIYDKKFPGSFDELRAFNGVESDFILFKIRAITGWIFENNKPIAPVNIHI